MKEKSLACVKLWREFVIVFESKDLDVLRWIPGNINIADALTKRDLRMHRLLNRVMTTGILCIDLASGHELDSETWL